MQSDGWILRQDIIWAKNNPLPESVKDRCTKSHEYLFLFSKSLKYHFDNEAIKEPMTTLDKRPPGVVRDRIYDYNSKLKILTNRVSSKSQKAGCESNMSIENQKKWAVKAANGNLKRNRWSVWRIFSSRPFKGAHFATFPQELIEPCILAGCPVNGTVLDPFFGAGTTGIVAERLYRNYIGIELNQEYIKLAKERIKNETRQMNQMRLLA